MADDDWIILQVVYHFPWLRLLQIHLTPLEGLLYGYLHKYIRMLSSIFRVLLLHMLELVHLESLNLSILTDYCLAIHHMALSLRIFLSLHHLRSLFLWSYQLTTSFLDEVFLSLRSLLGRCQELRSQKTRSADHHLWCNILMDEVHYGQVLLLPDHHLWKW